MTIQEIENIHRQASQCINDAEMNDAFRHIIIEGIHIKLNTVFTGSFPELQFHHELFICYQGIIRRILAPRFEDFRDLRSLTAARAAKLILLPLISEEKISTAHRRFGIPPERRPPEGIFFCFTGTL